MAYTPPVIPDAETGLERFERDILEQGGTRKDRGWDEQTEERKQRQYASAGDQSNVTLPTITGTAQVGETLTGSNGTWSQTPDSYTYRWLADDVEIDGATSATYELTASEEDAIITFEVTAILAEYDDEVAVSEPTEAVIAA